jgi:NTP pyrophosphatase (non-canonical NTP hydrolase)
MDKIMKENTTLTLESLLSFIDKHEAWIKKSFNFADNENLILKATVKLYEEIGELSEEILFHTSCQRKEKMEHHDKDNLPKEFADVLISSFLLAKFMNIDVKKALEEKIKIIIEKMHDGQEKKTKLDL